MFLIIQQGQINLSCRRPKSNLTGKVMDSVTVEENGKPKILSLDFIKGKRLDYDIKSDKYSVIYFL